MGALQLSYHSAGLLCSLVAVALYANTLECGLCFDDDAAIENNQDLRPNVSWSNLVKNDFWGTPIESNDSHKSYRPLCVATFRLNYLLHELQPMGYHLVNILLHGAVCYLYVQLCGLVFSQVWPSLIAGLLFAVHPIHTEAVAGVVGRADVLSGLFFITTLLTYRKAVLSNGLSSYGWLFGSLTFILCASLSKEIGLTVVGVAVIYEFIIMRHMDLYSTLALLRLLVQKKSRNLPSWFGQFLVRVLVLALFSMLFLFLRVKLNQGPPTFSMSNNPALFFPSPYRQLHWSYLSVFNLQLLLDPAHLCAEYSMGTVPPIQTLTDTRNILTLLSFSVLFLFGLYSIQLSTNLRRTILFGLSLIVFPYLPASNLFFPVGFVIAERILYLPSMGFCLLVGYGAWKLVQSTHNMKTGIAQQKIYRMIFIICFLALLVSHATKTVTRNRDWYTSHALYLSAVKVTPNNAKMISNLGAMFEKNEELSLSEDLFRYGTEVEPLYVSVWINLAGVLRETDRHMESIEAYQTASDLVVRGIQKEHRNTVYTTPINIKVFNSLSNMLREHTNNNTGALHYANLAIKFEPHWANGYHSRGKVLLKTQRYREAKVSLLKAVDINPNMSNPHSNLGEVLFELKEYELSEKHLRKSLELAPDSRLTKFRLANLIVHADQRTQLSLKEAESLLQEVLELEPKNGNASFCLGLVYFDLKDQILAEDNFVRSLNITAHHSGSLYNLGLMLSSQNRFPEAVAYLEELLTHHPGHINGLSQLATCYQQTGQRERAVDSYARVLERNPNHLQALQNLGVMMLENGNNDKAMELLERLAVINPADTSIRKQLGILIARKNKKKLSKP